MNTNNIKSFAKQARLLLIDGVLQRLKYWGFNPDGDNSESLQTTQGGFIFREQVFTDTSIPKKWNKLKKRLNNKQDVKDVIEEAAYTWFNRLMAIKILEINGYLSPTLEFAQEIQIPLLVQNAKKGLHNLTKQADIDLLTEYLQEDKEEQAFGLLVTDLCNTNATLHDVFGKIDDYTELLLPQNLMQPNGLLDLINGNAINKDDFKEVELIGWLYQFYISDKKDEVFAGFKKNLKARAEDIPAATQIFTPKWIVKYMVENTVGKIYLDYAPESLLRAQMKYLVENDADKSPLTTLHSQLIIHNLSELTLIDPASGSGHILVTGFELLFRMYREEGYTARQAVDSILKNNIYGLDIDDRAMQLARFAVLLKAAQFDAEVLNRGVIPNIYSFPEATLADSFKEEYYSKAQSDWYELKGMKLKKPVTMQWTETEIDPKTKKEKEVKKSMTVPIGTILNEAIIDTLQTHCEESILVDYSADLENFWGTDKLGFVYSEFFYAIQLLQQGKNLGSTIKLILSDEALKHTKQKFQEWSTQDASLQLGAFDKVLWENLKPHLEVLFVLTKRYTSVVANPPYMGQKSMNGELKDYVNTHYPVTKSDLMTIFMEVIPNLTADNSRFALINLPSWLFLSSFEEIRKYYIDNYTFDSLLHMGRGIFGIDFGSVAFAIKKTTNIDAIGSYFRLHERNFQHIYFEDIEKLFLYSNDNEAYKYDFTQYRGDEGITEIPKQGTSKGLKLFYPNIPQTNFYKIPGSPIAYWLTLKYIETFQGTLLDAELDIKTGLATADNVRFVRNWYEVDIAKSHTEAKDSKAAICSGAKWFPYNKGGGYRKWYGNRHHFINWENDGYEIKNFVDSKGRKIAAIRNEQFYFREGITWSDVSSGSFACRYTEHGFVFDMKGSSGFTDELLFYKIGLLNSKFSTTTLSILNPTLSFQVGNIKTIPIVFDYISKIEYLTENCVNISKIDWNSFETSWDFENSPLLNNQNSLAEAFKIWNRNVTQDFFQLHTNEEELNRIFINIYGLQDELTPEVALKDITILQDELDRNTLEALEPVFREKGKDAIELPINKAEILSQFVSYAIGVFLGRYRLDKPGLNIAHPNPTDEELAPYTLTINHSPLTINHPPLTINHSPLTINHPPFTINIDEDGILPLMGEDCAFPDDALVRTKDLILAIWGENSLTDNINFLHDCLGMDLNKWLTEKFWGYHTGMYKKKPIYWLFSSDANKPQNAAFKVLVYMHRMDKYTVQKIQRNYLHPHQEYIKREIGKLQENELTLSRDELKKLEKLRNWEIECRDYNEVLKELANQQIVFDLDDGVDANYAKFEGAVAVI